MAPDEISREVSLLCPTCGGTQFEMGDNVDEPDALVRCIGCDRKLTNSELLSENQGNIDQHLTEIGDEVTKAAADELTKAMRNASRGNKYIKFE